MRIFNRIPVGAVKNADIFGKSQSSLKENERVVDTAVDIENLPAYGKVVIAESNVLRMAKKLSYGIRSVEEEAELQKELAELRTICEEHSKLKEAIAHV